MAVTRVVIRKRDGKRYWCDFNPVLWPGLEHLGFCYLLLPCGFSGRRHYKTLPKFMAEYRTEQGANHD